MKIRVALVSVLALLVACVSAGATPPQASQSDALAQVEPRYDTTLAQTAAAAVQIAQPSPACSMTLQSLVDAAPAGSTLDVPPCIFRETVAINKPLTLDGHGLAGIRGSDIWTAWSPSNGGYISTLTVPTFNTHDGQGQCTDGSNKCNWPEQVFVNGTPLTEVSQGSTPASGQFALDGSRHVLLHDNPANQAVEVTTRETWVQTNSDNVTIQGMIFWHAGNAAETGAIGNQNHNGWTLQNDQLYYAHGGIVSLGGASNPNTQTTVRGNVIAGSGYEAINGFENTNTLIASNVIYNNNLSGFDWVNWAGAGIKVVTFTNLTIDGNEVRNNNGPGIWCDIGCQGVTISNNRVHDNQGAGILFEISTGAKIFNNAVWNIPNAPAINVSTSASAEVSSNIVAWSNEGIAVFSEDRAGRPSQGTTNISIHDNAVLNSSQSALSLEWYQHGNGNLLSGGSNNSGSGNAFWYPGDENGGQRFRWGQYITSLANFNQTPGGAHDRYMSGTERDQMVSGWQIPPK